MIRNEKLKSGLELVYYPVPHTRFAEIALAVGVGTRHEPARLMGLSHFTEHMLFRGCRTMPSSLQLNLEFERIGEGLNALTHKEFTLFTTKVPVEELSRALELLAAVVSEPLFRDIDTERGIIREEILEELDEKGNDTDLDNISRKLVFGKHPLAYPVLGRLETVKNITEAPLRKFHAAYYVPENMVLAIAGGAPWAKSLEFAQKAFARNAFPARNGGATPKTPRSARLSDAKPGVHFVDDKGSQVEVLLSFFMPGERAPGELSRMFLSRVLDDGLSSRLQRTVCDVRGLVYDISSGIESFTDIELFDIQFSVSPGKLVETVDAVVGELRLLRDELVGPDEFQLVRERFRRDIYATAESARGMADLLAEAFLLQLPMPLEPKEYEARINELTPESVRDEARRGFRLDRCVLVAKGKVSAAAKANVRRLLSKF